MTSNNPAMRARVAADALDRLVQDVQTGRARWDHEQTIRQTTDELARLTAAMASTLQQLAAAYGQQTRPGPAAEQTLTALHQAGQHTVTAADRLRQARRTMTR
ncbi:hypothetical protein ACF1FX_34510 [Streptomyces sp. NPDC014646]|uniref:hypothetical protein n=1 Tax=Streptomyces sp. NPDC014646 TaxID=3364877 RepID=UPI0036F8E6DE